MSYAVQQPPVPTAIGPTASGPGRPGGVTAAVVLLWVMAAVGLVYAIATLIIVPGTISRFRDAASGAFPGVSESDQDGYIAVVWIGAAIALALGIIVFALYVVLGLALRRGSNAARIATLVVAVLGTLGGLVAGVSVLAQRGTPSPGTLSAALTTSYPGGWVGTNMGLSFAQVGGYLLVVILLLTAPRAFFGRPAPAAFAAPSHQPGYASLPHLNGRHTPGVAGGPVPGSAGPVPGSAGPMSGTAGPMSGLAGPVPGMNGPGQAGLVPGMAGSLDPGASGQSPGHGTPPGYGFPPNAQPGYGPQPGSGALPGYGAQPAAQPGYQMPPGGTQSSYGPHPEYGTSEARTGYEAPLSQPGRPSQQGQPAADHMPGYPYGPHGSPYGPSQAFGRGAPAHDEAYARPADVPSHQSFAPQSPAAASPASSTASPSSAAVPPPSAPASLSSAAVPPPSAPASLSSAAVPPPSAAASPSSAAGPAPSAAASPSSAAASPSSAAGPAPSEAAPASSSATPSLPTAASTASAATASPLSTTTPPSAVPTPFEPSRPAAETLPPAVPGSSPSVPGEASDSTDGGSGSAESDGPGRQSASSE